MEMATHPTFTDFVNEGLEVPDGTRELCRVLEGAGWFPRGRWKGDGLRYWPDGGRGRQLIIDLRVPMNEARVRATLQHAGVSLTVQYKEEKEEQ